MSEIEIPGEAIRATYKSPYADSLTNKSIRSVLELGGPLVVAAEFRRLAEFLEEPADVDKLLAHAAELDPQGGTR